MKNQSTTEKSKTTTFKNVGVAVIIVLSSFLPYLHDLEIFKGVRGFSGFSSLRVGIWAVSLFAIALAGWIFAFINSKGKSYRFIMLAPIFMLAFQLGIYLFNARKTTTNELSTKIIVNLLFCILLVSAYYFGKSRRK